MTSLIGYARVSTRAQNPGSQEAELSAAGATRVFVDHGESSRVADRPQWSACLDHLRPGDTLVIRALDRIAGSEVMAIQTIAQLHDRGLNIRSLTEPEIDTTTPVGGTLFGIVAVFAQLRSDTMRDNTRRGLANARAQGRVGGRPSVMTPERTAEALRMRDAGRSQAKIARVLGVGASSIARALAKTDEATPRPSSQQAGDRVFFRDHKPYFAPTSLDELRGPVGGVLELPHHVHWGPQRNVDLDSQGGVLKSYEAALQEGSVDDQAAIINRDRLLSVWEDLALPDRVRMLWEERFPQLLERMSE